MSLSEWTQSELKRLEQKIDQVDADLGDLRTTLLDRMRQLEERVELLSMKMIVIDVVKKTIEGSPSTDAVSRTESPSTTSSPKSITDPKVEDIVNEKGERWDE